MSHAFLVFTNLPCTLILNLEVALEQLTNAYAQELRLYVMPWRCNMGRILCSSINLIQMSTTTNQNTALGRAYLVEQCSCPTGYTGTSCEVGEPKSDPIPRWSEVCHFVAKVFINCVGWCQNM